MGSVNAYKFRVIQIFLNCSNWNFLLFSFFFFAAFFAAYCPPLLFKKQAHFLTTSYASSQNYVDTSDVR